MYTFDYYDFTEQFLALLYPEYCATLGSQGWPDGSRGVDVDYN